MRLLDIYPVAEWFENNGFEVETKSKGGEFIAVFRKDSPDYTDEPMAVYERFLKDGKLSERFDIDVFEPERPPHLSGFRGFNAQKVGQHFNFEY